jgi:hypothetical protein
MFHRAALHEEQLRPAGSRILNMKQKFLSADFHAAGWRNPAA